MASSSGIWRRPSSCKTLYRGIIFAGTSISAPSRLGTLFRLRLASEPGKFHQSQVAALAETAWLLGNRMDDHWEFAPHRREEIVRDLRRVHSQSDQLWARFDDQAFFRPLGSGWSPAQNVVHLTKSTRIVATALRVPRFLLGWLFGKAANASIGYGALRSRYQEILAKGGGAGKFTPREYPLPANPTETRARLMAGLFAAVEDLARRLEKWSEADLDCHRLPHPLLGKLTVRDMLLFTVQHLAHHASKVEERLRAVLEVRSEKGN